MLRARVTEVPHLHRFVRAVVLENSPREMKLAQSSTRHEPPSPIGACQNDRRPDRSNRETDSRRGDPFCPSSTPTKLQNSNPCRDEMEGYDGA